MNSERAKNTEPCKVRVWSERCNQTNMLGDQVVCWKLGRLWLIEFLQESFGSSWRAIPSNYPKNLDSVWSGNAFFIFRWYVLTYFTVESSCYKTWVAGNHRQTVYEIKLPPFYLRVLWAMEEKIRARSFSRRFLHMRGTIWEWNVEKLEGGGSQILQTSHLHGVVCPSIRPPVCYPLPHPQGFVSFGAFSDPNSAK